MMSRFLAKCCIVLLLAGCGPRSFSPTPVASGTLGSSESGHEHEEAGKSGEQGDEHSGHGHESEGEEGEHEHKEGEHAEGFVELTEAQVKELGLEIGTVSSISSGSLGKRTGKVEVNPDRRVIVSSQLSGTIRDLPVIVGARLQQGDLVAVLQSPEITELKNDYHAAQVEVELANKELSNTRSLLAVGDESRREVEAANLEVAQAKAKRDAVSARLESTRLSYSRLQKLREEGIASAQQVEQSRADLKALEADLREAKTAVDIAVTHRDREQRVARSELRQKAEVQPAEAKVARAQESLKHLVERLRQLGADPDQNEGALSLLSPIAGQVVERPVNRGQVIAPGDTVAVLIDPSEVWVLIDLLREDLNQVGVGDEVEIALASDPSVKVRGQISYVNVQLESASQTVRARVELREPGTKFRVGGFVTATLLGKASQNPTIPQTAIVEVEGKEVVYRKDGEGYRRTPVEVLSGGDTQVASVKGLPAGSEIVIKGAAALKSVDLAGSIGGHTH